jgi:hypothetical protein
MHPATPTPAVGRPLPRAAEAYTAPEKLDWILAEHGHGAEWLRVFRIRYADAERRWAAIARAVLGTPVFRVVNRGQYGVVCGVTVQLTLNARSAKVTTSWHYAAAGDAPRLVTAYPTS